MNRNVVATLELGQFQSQSKNYIILDENGKELKFNSNMAALNYMSERGWHFEQTYFDEDNEQHWLLSKVITEKSQIIEGLQIKNLEPDTIQ